MLTPRSFSLSLSLLGLVPLLAPTAGCKPKDDSADADTDTDTDADTDTDTDTDADTANLPPTAPVISISPAAPSGTLDLVASVDTPSEDPESQTVTYAWAWSVDGTDRPDLDTKIVPASELTEGAEWTVVATPNDGAQDGEPGTASATVHNDAPTVLAHLEPLAPNPGETINFVYDTEPTDPNGDALTTTIKWYKNDAYHIDWDGLTTIDGLQVRGGDVFVAKYSTTDGLLSTDTMEATVTVTNTPPEITSATLSPDPCKDGDDIKVKVNATDADDNDLTYSYVWYRNGVEATDVGDSDTVPASATEVDDVWYCEATVSDGTDTAVYTTDSLTVIPWEGTHEVYTFSASIPTDAATSTGSWAIQYLTHGSRAGENDCDLYWTFTGVEDKPICRGCEFRFDTTLTYDAAASTVVTGCDAAQVDGTGEWFYNSSGGSFYADMSGPTLGAGGIRMSFANSGGSGTTDSAGSNYQYYTITSTEDSAGTTTFTAYWNYGNLTY